MHFPNPDRTRRIIGLILFLGSVLAGGTLLALLFLVLPVFESSRWPELWAAMALGAVLAFPAGAMYLTVPRLLDRYDPEPAYALIGCLVYGGLAACGFSALVNSVVGEMAGAVAGPAVGDAVGTVVSAPITEEFFKGLGLLGVFYFLKREFDGVVDGVIYATFIAIGFATVENVTYYARAVLEGQAGGLAITFVLRGILAPWGHPLYTSMTGLGFGLARESARPFLRVLGPVIGFAGAVTLHAVWNGSALLASGPGGGGGLVFLLLLPLWLLFVTAFLIMLIALVRRRGRIIRDHLRDEVAIGTITAQELELTGSAFGLLKARMQQGPEGAALVRAIARLSLSKWHSVRALKSNSHTMSMEFVGPLRQQIGLLRGSVRKNAGG